MLAFLSSLLFLLQAAPEGRVAGPAAAPGQKPQCGITGALCPKPDDKRYRLPLPIERVERSARDALKNDGSACAIIGQTICKRKPRPVLRVGETPQETLSRDREPE